MDLKRVTSSAIIAEGIGTFDRDKCLDPSTGAASGPNAGVEDLSMSGRHDIPSCGTWTLNDSQAS
jgi:hypothetical protein